MRARTFLATVCMAVWLPMMFAPAWAELSLVSPESVGLSSERLARIEEHLGKRVANGELAGAVTLVARFGKVAHFSAVGYRDAEQRLPIEKDTVFRIYSMTKPIASTALMMLYQDGLFQLRDPLSKFIPEFADLKVLQDPDGPLTEVEAASRQPTVQDVLRHTAGFSHGLGIDEHARAFVATGIFRPETSLQAMMSALSNVPLLNQPGDRFRYSVGPDIALRLVEILSGTPADVFLEQRMFKPLRMVDTGYWMQPDEAKRRLAPVHWLKEGRLVPIDDQHGRPGKEGRRGVLTETWSVNSYTADHAFKGGSFGLLSTAEDYWRYAQAMANGGELDGTRILGRGIVDFMRRNHLTPEQGKELAKGGLGFGLGFGVVKNPALLGYPANEGDFFWGGAAATSFWIDPTAELVVVSMTQHMGVRHTQSLRGELRALVYGALVD